MNVIHDLPHATEVFDRLLELTVLLNEDMTRALARDGLTVPRTHLLWMLHQQGASTQRALADALKVTPRNITGLIDGLTEAGYLTREPHPSDRRASLATLTPAGASLMDGMARGREELAARLFGDLPADELRGFLDGIDGVTARLRAALDDEGPP